MIKYICNLKKRSGNLHNTANNNDIKSNVHVAIVESISQYLFLFIKVDLNSNQINIALSRI